VRELVGAGHDVMVIHRGVLEVDDEPVGVVHAHVDRFDADGLAQALASCETVIDTYALTRRDADAVVAAAPKQSRLVVLSSCDVYRAYQGLLSGAVIDAVPLSEDAPLRTARFPYRGKLDGMDDYDKLDVEAAVLARGGTVARLGFVIGPHDPQQREQPILRRVRAGRSAIPIGTANFIGSRVLVDDVAVGLAQMLDVPVDHVAGEAFNLVELASPTLELWARWIIEDCGANLALIRVLDRFLPPDLALFGHRSQPIQCSPAKAVAMLGWSPTDPREATRQSVAWHMASPPHDADDDFTADDEALAHRVDHQAMSNLRSP
jgi:nucleoside-diphosphate-sugar epimerase